MSASVRHVARLLLAVCLLGTLIAGLIVARHDTAATLAWAKVPMATLHRLGVVGWCLFVAAQFVVAAFGVLPASLMGVIAGAVYGIPLGFALASVATMAGAALSFRLSRSVFRPMVLRMLARHGRLAGAEAIMAREGWRLVMLLRINPVLPFAPTSFLLGVSPVIWKDYFFGTLASLPGLLLFVALGGCADIGLAVWQSGAYGIKWLLPGIGVLAALALSMRLIRAARLAKRSQPPTTA